MKISGWGRFPTFEGTVEAPRSEKALQELVRGSGAIIARGNGRAYGDSAVSPGATVHMRHFNHMLAFDPEQGQLIAEAGVLLGDIITAFLPRGWFPAVTPGTKFVTLGGMIAADVHGKNHHRDGGMGTTVDWIDVMGADGSIVRCSRDQNTDLFEWTLGGMGLTGTIIRAAIRLRRVETAWIQQTTIPAENLDAAIEAFEQAQDSTYSVAWIDCLGTGAARGRSLVMLGEHAVATELSGARAQTPLQVPRKRKLTIPVDFPVWALNRYTVRAFNTLYYKANQYKDPTTLVDWDSYFYPLDAMLGWNRIYGRKGFMQFQCVLPLESSRAGLNALLEAIAAAQQGSFLAVLKRFGPQQSRISFPMEGYTLALDFPVNRGSLRLLEDLDGITCDHGGRFYLAKDSRMSHETLRRADPRIQAFTEMRQDAGLPAHFLSEQAKRLKL